MTPEGLPNECFGDVAMITEFIANYSGLLMPEDEYPIYTGTVMSPNIAQPRTLCTSSNYYDSFNEIKSSDITNFHARLHLYE